MSNDEDLDLVALMDEVNFLDLELRMLAAPLNDGAERCPSCRAIHGWHHTTCDAHPISPHHSCSDFTPPENSRG